MRSIGIVLCAALAISCSSSKDASAPGSDGVVCGTGGVKGTAHVIDATNLSNVGEVEIAADGCTAAKTDDRGYVDVTVAANEMTTWKLTKEGYVKEQGTFALLRDGVQAQGYMWPDGAKNGFFAGWTADKGYLAVVVLAEAGDAGGGCTRDGVVLSLQDHPEITFAYARTPSERNASLTATDGFGAGVAGPLPAGTYAIVGTKTGCKSIPSKDNDVEFAPTVTVVADTLGVASVRMVSAP